MEQFDLTRLYKVSDTPNPAETSEITQERPIKWLSLTGAGEPEGEGFLERIKALYATVYAIKFRLKKAGREFAVPKLEVFRYANEYQLQIGVPAYVTEQDVRQGVASVTAHMNIQHADAVEFHGEMPSSR